MKISQQESEAIAAMKAAAQELMRAEELAERAGYGQLVLYPLAEARKEVRDALDTVLERA